MFTCRDGKGGDLSNQAQKCNIHRLWIFERMESVENDCCRSWTNNLFKNSYCDVERQQVKFKRSNHNLDQSQCPILIFSSGNYINCSKRENYDLEIVNVSRVKCFIISTYTDVPNNLCTTSPISHLISHHRVKTSLGAQTLIWK